MSDHNRKAWADFLINAAAAGAEFQPVVVKTLKSHYHEIIQNLAARKHESLLTCHQPDIVKYERRVNETAARIEAEHTVTLRPFIEVSSDNHVPIVVCLDVKQINDDSWCDVLDALTEIEFSVGRTLFGEAKTFGPGRDAIDPNATLDNMRQSFI